MALTLRPLEWLIGDWEAEPDPSGATGGSTFALVAGDSAIVRTSWAEYPAGDRRAGRHDDVLLIFVERGDVAGLYADNEGHVIRYQVSVTDDRAVFVSAEGPGPRFRLTYERQGEREANVRFEIAPPGADFASYVGGRIRRSGPR